MFIQLENKKLINLKRCGKVIVKETDEGAVVEYELDDGDVILDRFETLDEAETSFEKVPTDTFVKAEDSQLISKEKVTGVKIDPNDPTKVEYEIAGMAPAKVKFESEEEAQAGLEVAEKAVEGEGAGEESSPSDPEITAVDVTPEEGLKDPVAVGTKVATVAVTGGTEPYTYTAGGGTDDAKFTITSENITAKEELTEGTYTLKVKVTDSKTKTKTSADVTITVGAKDAEPEEEETITVSIPSQVWTTQTSKFGEYQIGDSEVTGYLNYVTGLDDYSAGAEGNFFAIEVAEAKAGKTVSVVLTGAGTASKPEQNLDDDGILVCKIGGTDNQLTIKNGKTTKTLKFTQIQLLPDVTKVVVASDQEHQTWNKKVKELQSADFTITKDCEMTGTVNYITDFSAGGGVSGNYIHVHVNKDQLPTGADETNIKFGFPESALTPDKADWNYCLGVDDARKTKRMELTFKNKVLYSIGISKLTIKPNEIKGFKKVFSKK